MDVGWPFKENYILWDFLTQPLSKSYKFKKNINAKFMISFIKKSTI